MSEAERVASERRNLGDDLGTLRSALTDAGIKAVGTLACALSEAAALAKNDHTAGRPGSWEADTLHTLTRYGRDLPGRRVHEQSCAAIRDVLVHWATSPDGYVEMAETLSVIFGAVVDDVGGWTKVADVGVRSLGYADQIRNLVTRHSEKYGPSSGW